MKKIYLIIVLVFLLTSGIFVFYNAQTPHVVEPVASTNQISPEAVPQPFSYKGETGKNALTLLQSKTTTALDKSGMVVMINGKMAQTSKREYWAFYINGKMAPVGPKDYMTKDTDTLEWKIEKY